MIDYINECVGCEDCVRCGRKHLMVYICDNCGEIIYNKCDVYSRDGNDYDYHCYIALFSDEDEDGEDDV